MTVENMKSYQGNAVPNQFIITEEGHGAHGNFREMKTFQSYKKTIAIVTVWDGMRKETELDEDYWDSSNTTGKYRNQFLDETKRETEAKIASGEYKLKNLNK